MMTKNACEDTQLKATFDIPRSASGTTTMIPYSLQRFEMSDTHSNTSDIDRQLLAVDDDLIYDEDDITSLPMATKEGRTWQYKRLKDTCAPLASLESMGMCLLETDRITFDVTRNYASPTDNVSPQSAPEDEMGSPSRIESFDSLSDLAGNSNTFSRNGSSNSIGPSTATAANGSTHQHIPLSTSFPHQPSQHTHHHTSHTAGLHRSPTHHHQHPHHQVCGSIDSGYSNDNSIDITSLTDSSHTGMNDSIYTGPRFSIGLSEHCNPENSNIFMKPSDEFSVDSGKACPSDNQLKLTKMASKQLNITAVDDDHLRNDLEQTVMKRQESDASYVSSTVVRPPTTQRSDTLDSNTTPVAGGSEGGGSVEEWERCGDIDSETLTRTRSRRRSGAFSYHGNSTTNHPSSDHSQDDRTKNTNSLERDPLSLSDVKRLVRERGRQVTGRVFGEEDDEVFSNQLCDHFRENESSAVYDVDNTSLNGDDGGCGVFLPEVRVSCSPPSQPLASCWIDGDTSDNELSIITSDTCPVSLLTFMCLYALHVYVCIC